MSLIRGDARLLPLVDGCVDCVVTSPPYWGLRDYGAPPAVWGGDEACSHSWEEFVRDGQAGGVSDKQDSNVGSRFAQQQQCDGCGAWRGALGLEPSPDLFVAHITEIFREIRRVLKPAGTCWLNLGDSYANPDKGGYQPTRVKAEDSMQRGNLASDFYGAPNRNWQGLAAKNLVGIPWRVAFALQADGWYLRSDIIWHKPNPMPESVTDRPTKAHEYLFLLTKSERYFYDARAIAEPSTTGDMRRPYGSQGAWALDGRPEFQRHGGERREVYKGQATKDYDAAGAQNPSDTKRRILDAMSDPEYIGRNKRTVWTIPTRPYSGAHFATMPEDLVEPCILAGCPLGGLVLDPFCGTGTVISVAQRLGRRGVGVDLSYQSLAKERTAQRGLRFEAV